MSPEQKPEWFQIADADNAASPRKISKGLPVIALVAVAAILGVGAVMAQTQEESPANATETVAPAVVDSTQTSTAPSNSGTANISAKPAKGSADNESVANPVIATDSPTPSVATKTGVANPAIGNLPTGGEHEGHDRNHEGGGDDEGEDD